MAQRRFSPAVLLIFVVILSPTIMMFSPITSERWLSEANGEKATDVKNESVSFNSNGTQVPATLYYPNDGGTHPAVVFGVGYTAELTSLFNSTNYGWLGEGLAARGYVVLVVKYATNLSNPMDVLTTLQNYTVWVEQTRDAVTALIHDDLGASVSTDEIVDAKRIGLGGHSIGGAVAIVSGAQDRRVKCVFALSPQRLGARPDMNFYAAKISPVPLQLQVGELDELGGVVTTQQTYNSANTPKEIVKYRYGTYEGFTDLGKVENIEIDDVPSAIKDILQPYLQTNPLSTKQVDMALNFTSGFLDYYLENHESFNIHSDYSEDFLMPSVPPFPPTTVPDVWHANVTASGLDVIFQSVNIDPEMLDFAQEDTLHISTRVTPRGIFETGVKASITFPEGNTEEHELVFDSSYSTSAGDFSVELSIPISHDLGPCQVVIKATDNKEHTYTSQSLEFALTTTSDRPVIKSVEISPQPMIPGEEISFSVSASDKDGIAYYSFDFGDGTKTGWVEEKTAKHTYENSGVYTVRIRAKDNKAQESNVWSMEESVSHPPVAKLRFDSPVYTGKSVVFDASESTDPDGEEIEYFFLFGDTGEDTGWISNDKVTHTFSDTGKFVVSLRVRDSNGVMSEWDNRTVNVEKESTFQTFTSSAGFPILIVIVVGAIIGGGYFLLKGEDKDTREHGKEEKVRGNAVERKIVAKHTVVPPSVLPEEKRQKKPDAAGSSEKKADIKKTLPTTHVTETSPDLERKMPVPEMKMENHPGSEPEIDAPPIEEDEGKDIWDDDDFAVPLALRDKLKKR